MGLRARFKVGIPQVSGDVHLLPCRIAAEQGILARHAPPTPDLRFQLLTVLTGVNGITVYYKGHRGLAAKVFHLGPSATVSAAFARYAAWCP